MDKKYVMVIDQGTTGTRVILFNRKGEIHSIAYQEIQQIYPKPGWVEHKPLEYWDTTMECIKSLKKRQCFTSGNCGYRGNKSKRNNCIME